MVAGGLVVQAADTGRVLLIQRLPDKHDDDNAYARWEFPGGCLDVDDLSVWDGALREWEEETGAALGATAEHAGSFLSPDGRYQAYVIQVPAESDLDLSPQPEEVAEIGWWDPGDLEDDRVRDKVQVLVPTLSRFLKANANIASRTGMVSLDLPAGTIPVIADGVPDQHITIVFLGRDVNDDLFAEACERAAAAAAAMAPPTGTVGGLGSFPPSDSSDAKIPVFAVPDVPGLDDLRAAFEDLNASEHKDYKPHVTLTYLEPGDPMPDPVPATPVTFTHLAVHRGDDIQRFAFGGDAEKACTAGAIAGSAGARARSGPGGTPPSTRARREVAPATVGPTVKASAARFHRHTDRIVEHYAPLISQALDAMVPDELIRDAIRHIQGEPVDTYAPKRDPFAAEKRSPIPPELVQRAIAILNNGLSTAGKLKAVLGDLWGDAGLQGANGAADAANGTMLSSLQSVVRELPDDYWDAWKPGWGQAAAKAADGGLARLLDQADITIKGITGTTLDRLGDTIADGVNKGDSVDAIAKAARAVVADPKRAWLIADTETARAMTATTMDTYRQNDVEQLDWLAEADACDDCEENAAASPVSIDEGFPNGTVPAHPRCRCSLAPHIDTGE